MVFSISLLLGSALVGFLLLSRQHAAIERKHSTQYDSIGEWEEETGFYQAIAYKKLLYKKQSKYQYIEVYETDYYGKVLLLDGVIQITERDADSYNEMMTQMAMMAHAKPKRALVIGGGDGYVLSEVLKHDSIEQVDYVDLDEDVIEACRTHFSWWKDDPRITIHIGDGADFVRKASPNTYDVIIQDSSDPWTTDDKGNHVVLPSSLLYTEQHFSDIHRILTPTGVFNFQAETFNIPSDLKGIVSWRRQALNVGFQRARYGSLYISSYPTGQIGFLLCEKNVKASSSMKHVEERFRALQKRGQGTSYYQPKLQESAFDLPLWVERTVYAEEDAETARDEL